MTGEAVPIFLDLVDRGIIRIVDARSVRKDDDGTFSGFRPADLDENTAGTGCPPGGVRGRARRR